MTELFVHKIVRQLCKLKSCPKLYSRLASSSVEKGRQFESLNIDGNKINGNRKDISKGPSLEHFIANTVSPYVLDNRVKKDEAAVPFIKEDDLLGLGRKVYFDVYGCQMNVSDTEIAWAVLQDKGYVRTSDITQADVVMVMTCAIREGAEHKVWKKLHHLAKMKRRKMSRGVGPQMKIAILGCMAERLKTQILEREQLVDIVCGPDAYRDLPRLLAITENRQAAVNVLLSLEETYADVMPVRLNQDSVTAYVSIMRGCDNMCAYCIVPFTRGRERSRPIDSILEEVRMLSDQGVKEITLLGQNVNSYRDISDSQHFGLPDLSMKQTLSDGFRTVYRARSGGRRFSDLLDKVSQVDPEMRIRFTAPHPKDFPDEVIELIKDRPTVCGQLHLPAQSGNDDVLSFMRRGYTGQAYRQLVDRVRSILPNVCLTSDFICGFCGESEAAFEDTLALVRDVQYSMVFAYPYSMRQKTHAYHKLIDDVPADIKQARVEQLQQEFRCGAGERNKSLLGHNHLVLVQGPSKKGTGTLFGRNDGGLGVIFPDTEVTDGQTMRKPEPGDYIVVRITDSTAQTLHGEGVEISSIQRFNRQADSQ